MPVLGFALGLKEEQHSDRRERRKKPELRRSRSGAGRRRKQQPDAHDSAVQSSDPHSGKNSSSDHGAVLCHQLSFSHLAGRDSGGPDPDSKKSNSYPTCESLVPHRDKNPPFKSKEPSDAKDGAAETLDLKNHSFSLALRECQNQRFGSEAPSLKPQRRRPASLDLNSPRIDTTVLSPRFLMSGTKRSSAASSRSRTATFLSPGTPSYRHGSMAAGYQKGWSSERVPLPANCSRRYLGSNGLLPFNNGRTVPSKWEDAEKWICSPVSGDWAGRSSVPPPHHRRPKSKSGPLGAPLGGGGPYSSSASPLGPCFDNGRAGGFALASPLLTGVLMADRGCCGSYSSAGSGGGDGGEGRRRSSAAANVDSYIQRSASLHGWSEAFVESSSSLPCTQGTVQDEKLDSTRASAIVLYPPEPSLLRKDMATQMSPQGSTHSSPKGRPSFSHSTPPTHQIEALEPNISKMDIRDVLVDDCVTVTRWSKKHIGRVSSKRQTNTIEWKKENVEVKPSAAACEASDTARIIKKREEAKITAWENLQKAKAEAAIRKLEMKLEKKRSSSMLKILNRLRSSQKKAHEMRTAAADSQSQEASTPSKRSTNFCKTRQTSSLSGCFTCPAF